MYKCQIFNGAIYKKVSFFNNELQNETENKKQSI